MGRANKASRPSIAGVLVLDKPVGISSMAAVSVVRGKSGGAKTGHAGTLDPLADGVLVLALGKATKHLKHFMDTDKRYRTVIDLSAFTTTDDLEGERSEIEVVAPPSPQEVRSALQAFVGTIQQRPPVYSAVKISGRRAYQLARRGERVDLPTRTTTVYGIDFHPKRRELATGSRDGRVKIWALAENGEAELARELSPSTPCYSVRFEPDGEHLLTAHGDGKVRRWSDDPIVREAAPSPER